MADVDERPVARVTEEPFGAYGPYSRFRDGLRAYRMIAAMWIRSTMAYRASFVMTAFGNFAATAFDFVAIPADVRPRSTSWAASPCPRSPCCTGTSAMAFGLADLMIGSMDRLGRRVRDGTLDTLLVRPAPVLAQVAADKFALRRLGRITQGAVILGYALATLDIAWTPLKVLMLPMMVVSGGLIFGAGVRRGRGLPVRRAGRPPRCRTPSRTAVPRFCSTRRPSSPRTCCAG